MVTDDGPYPGPRPFEENDAPRFFGRDFEGRELVSLIVAHKCVLLYATSGAGKTSLVNAGVIPELRRRGMVVLPVGRVRALSEDELRSKKATNVYMHNLLLSLTSEKTDKPPAPNEKLVDYLKKARHARGPAGQSPRLLVIDQFEELFASYPDQWRQREDFFRQIARAVERFPTLRVLLALREDFLAACDRYRDLLPGRLRTQVHLEALSPQAAVLAIEKPLETTPRRFARGVARRLVDRLRKVSSGSNAGEAELDEFVEPVQLQVVCQHLWRSLPPDTAVITADHLTPVDVDEVLGGFYEDAVSEAAREGGVNEREVRQWFESQLITPAGTRGTVFKGELTAGGLPLAAVEALEHHRIIRSEFRARGQWYELTHDRLIAPIRASNLRVSPTPKEDEIFTSGFGSRAFFIMSVTSIEEVCAFDEEGSGMLERTWSDIAITQNVIDLRIPFKIRFDADDDAKILVPKVESLGSTPVVFEFRPEESRAGIAGGDVVLKGQFAAGSKVDGFVLKQPFVKAICTDLARAREAYAASKWKAEYAGATVPFEVERLVLRVRFPASHHRLTPPPQAVVFLDGSETVLEEVTQALNEAVSYSGTEAVLEVVKPKPNVSYAISWLPPDTSKPGGDSLRSRSSF